MVKARTICCKAVVDVSKAPKAKIKGQEYVTCNDTCKKFIEGANEKQLKEMLQ
jgi:YHS domain-containing protein